MSRHLARGARRRIGLLVVPALAASLCLSGCVPFGQGDEETYKAGESIAEELDVPSLGKTEFTSQWGTGTFSDLPTVEYIVSGDSAAQTLDDRLDAAGFVHEDSGGVYTRWTRATEDFHDIVNVRVLKSGESASRSAAASHDNDESVYIADVPSVQIRIVALDEQATR
jgi:hypothetical protein